MYNWTKTVNGNYITAKEYEGKQYRIQVFSSGIYKIVEIVYKINIMGRKEAYNKIISEGYSSNIFESMSLAEKDLNGRLSIVEEPTILQPEKPKSEESIPLTEEEETKLKSFHPEIYEALKEDIEEQKAPVCNTPTINVIAMDNSTYITINGDDEDEIRFTTNNKSVSVTSKLYRKPFLLRPDMVVKAVAFNENKKKSKQAKYIPVMES